MLWPSDSLAAVFAQIKKNSQAVDLSTLIITALDPDAVCATHMLCEALQSDNVLHTVHAVHGGMSKVDDTLLPLLELGGGGFKCVVMINCGAGVDLTARYGTLLDEGAFIFVCDSYRPIAHSNLLPTTTQVIVLGGEITEVDESVVPGADLPNDDDDEDEDDEEDDEDEKEEQEEEEEAKFAGEEEEEAASRHSAPRPTKRARREQRQQEREQLASLHHHYYAGSYLGDPSSHVMFQLCSQAGKEDNNLVWGALVGITHRYVLAGDLDDAAYADLLRPYEDLVRNRNVHVKHYRQSVDDLHTRIPNASAQDQIEYVAEEINLTLYRNWSLAEACKHTELFASKFRVWNNSGAGSELNMFFAKMGLSLANAEQKFHFMDRSAKRLVRQKILPTALAYGYGRMTLPSFLRRGTGYDVEISAEECARVLSTALEENGGGAHNLSRSMALLRNGRGRTSTEKQEWTAALTSAIAKVRLLTSETLATVQGGLLQNAGEFRWAYLDLHENGGEGNEGGEDNAEEHFTERGEYFSTSNGVVALAHAILLTNFEKWSNHQSVKPLVLAVNHRGRALVCGLPCPSELGTVQKNPFGQIFRHTARELQLTDSVDFGEFAQDYVIRLDAGEVQRFLLMMAKAA